MQLYGYQAMLSVVHFWAELSNIAVPLRATLERGGERVKEPGRTFCSWGESERAVRADVLPPVGK